MNDKNNNMNKIYLKNDLDKKLDEKANKLQELKEILPNLFDLDGNLIEAELKQFCSDEEDKPELERFTFNWAGKAKAKNLAYQKYMEGSLQYCKKDSVKPDETNNLLIQGDNLQVLKLLKSSYYKKVKAIYIDPPYNTGRDFVYKDKFELNIQAYLQATGEQDEEGKQVTEYIQKDNGKKHSKWLSFIYPRLMLARELLTDDGVIFVSIDDNEQAPLKMLMDEVFGEENFISCLTIINNLKGRSDSKYFATCNEYCLVYAHNILKCNVKKGEEISQEEIDNDYKFEDEKGEYRLLSLQKSGSQSSREDRPKMYYPILKKNNKFDLVTKEEYKKIYDNNKFDDEFVEEICNKYKEEGYETFLPINKKRWRWGYDTFNKEKDTEVECNNAGSVCTKDRARLEDGVNRLKSYKTTWYKSEYDTGSAGKTFKKLLESEARIFDNPKSVVFIKDILNLITKPGDIILDFFAGSGTTGQAVMELNQEEMDKDNLFRKFILVQLPKKIKEDKEAYKAGYRTIMEITKERLKRVGELYEDVDNGFKFFKLFECPKKDGELWNLGNMTNKDDFIVDQIALLYGYGLNYQLNNLVQNRKIYEMKSEFAQDMPAIIILENEPITKEDVFTLIDECTGEGQSYKLFARDDAVNIEIITNLAQQFKQDNLIVF